METIFNVRIGANYEILTITLTEPPLCSRDVRSSPDPEHDAKPDQEPGRVRQLQMSGQYPVYLIPKYRYFILTTTNR